MNKLQEHIPVFKKIRTNLSYLGHHYTEDINPNNMCGLCAVSSYIVFLYLNKHGLKPIFRMTNSHCWIELEDCFVDLTATQFDIDEEILIKPKKEFKKIISGIEDYRRSKQYFTIEDFKSECSTWVNGQNPNYLEKKSKIVKHLIKELV